ncbi:NAD(P)H-binding protein [Bizionia gelidisalsuginis]|uniref:NAD(P)H-binding protein n=1 Tax=Bizionia gelidisalsuginis TaxID=291188 RepID=A0ABY3M8J5_9FLAO|nr:NmrA family NAD(P)-binding protein [Bizionia gelidisalsuginis]TYC10565.1 NAD(P)H-binding protein [Bizionia gelidisalsuginis]
MTKVLITGATGNVGTEILKALGNIHHTLEIYAGVRKTNTNQREPLVFEQNEIYFDFTKIDTFWPALLNIDILFLLRPPNISDVAKYFKPLIDTAKKSSIQHIIFLSVQGVEKSKIIPHHKIEKLIVDSKISYTFLRPAYFMQNFTTTLRYDLVHNHRIYLPAGQARFTLIDLKDIGCVTAEVLINPQKYCNKSYELTNNETLTFAEMAKKISEGIGKNISYISPSLLQFFITKRKEEMPIMLILVMIMLHYFPRFQQTPKLTQWVKIITKKEPKTFEEFIQTNLKKIGKNKSS